jgi:uncharacterized protein (DUF885 family)
LWFAERSRETASIPYGAIGGYSYPVPYVLSQLTGSYQSVPDFLSSQHNIEDGADAQAYLDRLEQFHRNIDLDIETAKSDGDRGVIPPAVILEKALAQTRSLRAERGHSAGLVSSQLEEQARSRSAEIGRLAQPVLSMGRSPRL